MVRMSSRGHGLGDNAETHPIQRGVLPKIALHTEFLGARGGIAAWASSGSAECASSGVGVSIFLNLEHESSLICGEAGGIEAKG